MIEFTLILLFQLFLGPTQNDAPIWKQYIAKEIAFNESRGNAKIWDAWNITYGKYQVTPHLIYKLGYTIPMTEACQDEMMYELIDLYNDMLPGGFDNWVGKKDIHGNKISLPGLIYAMHFAPYGTLRYLQTGVDFSNGIISVSGKIRYYSQSLDRELQSAENWTLFA